MAARPRRSAAALLLCALLVPGCAEPPPVALRVGPIAYSGAELGALDRDARRDLAALTAFGLAAAGGELGELVEPLVRADLDSATVGRLRAEVALRRSGLSAAEIEGAYRDSPETELVVRHLVVLVDENAPTGRAGAARARAIVARNRVLAGEPFADVAAEVSEEPGAARRGGLLEPGREGDWVDPFWAAASALREGEVSDVVRTRYGFHVLRLEERRVLPLAQVRRDVAGRLVPDDRHLRAAQAWADSVTGSEGRHALLTEAEREGLGPTEAERERAAASWVAEAGRWAAVLGFPPGGRPEEVKAAALAALASQRQSAALARTALLERSGVLGLYPDSASSSEAVHADTSR